MAAAASAGHVLVVFAGLPEFTELGRPSLAANGVCLPGINCE
jgi:hypothetical protein